MGPGLESPTTVFADAEGRIIELPELEMAGLFGRAILVRPEPEELSPMPEGSKFFFLPDGEPIGWNADRETFASAGSGLAAVAAFPAPGFARTLLPASDFLESRTPSALVGRTRP